MSEHKTVVGVCEAQEIKGDWHTYAIRVDGFEYPVKLSTKKPELVALANAVGKQLATWGYLESDGNENPKKPGTFFKNRWLDSAVVVEGHVTTEPAEDLADVPAAPHPADSPEVTPPVAPVDWDAKDERRHRQAAVAISVSFFATGDRVSTKEVFDLAERIVAFVYKRVEYQAAEDLIADIPEDVAAIPFGEAA